MTDPTVPTADCGGPLEFALDQLHDKLHSFIHRRIPDDAPDADAVYWETLEAFETYVEREGHPPDTYPKMLFGIAGNKVGDYWRAEKRKRHSVLVEPSDLKLLAQGWSSPYETVEQRVDLIRAFAEAPLTDDMRRALVLVYVDWLSQDAAAALMDLHRSSLRRLLSKARDLILSSGLLDDYAGRLATTSAPKAAELGKSEVRS